MASTTNQTSTAPPLGQLIGESVLLTLRSVQVHAARIQKREVHPGRARLSETRAEWSGYRYHPTSIGRHLARLRAMGLVKRLQHGGGKPGGGRAADVYEILPLARRALRNSGDWNDAADVANHCPPRNVRRYAGIIARRVKAAGLAWQQRAIERGTILGDALFNARSAIEERDARELAALQVYKQAVDDEQRELEETLSKEPPPLDALKALRGLTGDELAYVWRTRMPARVRDPDPQK